MIVVKEQDVIDAAQEAKEAEDFFSAWDYDLNPGCSIDFSIEDEIE